MFCCQPVKSEDKKTDKDVVSTLTQFLESCPLGEFSVRLEMVYAFHCQLVHINPSEKQGTKSILSKLLHIAHFFIYH